MPWLKPIQLSWIRWTLRSHFFATVMLLITTHHTTRSSHQNACSGSRMLETRKWLTSLALINYFVCYYCPNFLLIKNVQPKKQYKKQSRNPSSKKNHTLWRKLLALRIHQSRCKFCFLYTKNIIHKKIIKNLKNQMKKKSILYFSYIHIMFQ